MDGFINTKTKCLCVYINNGQVYEMFMCVHKRWTDLYNTKPKCLCVYINDGQIYITQKLNVYVCT